MVEFNVPYTRLLDFVCKRSGLSPALYGDRDAFLRDYRRFVMHGREARKMIDYAIRFVPSRYLCDAARNTWSGRLVYDLRGWTYTPSQHFGTEYRRAACAVLAAAITDNWRSYNLSPADVAKKHLGLAIARRWFL
jgi:hypothetical protein